MSDRQAKRRRKAAKRKEKFFAALHQLTPPEGFTLTVGERDYGHTYMLAAERQVDGYRYAIRTRDGGNRWKHMDRVPDLMLRTLLARMERYAVVKPAG